MQDRISRYPGRIKLVPVDLDNGIYDVVRADEPTQVGTPLNTKNLFSERAKQQILATTLDFRKDYVDKPNTVDQGIRNICTLYGALECAHECDFSFAGEAAGKGEFLDTSIKYLASLGAVFVSIAFKITDQTFSAPVINIIVESADPTVELLFKLLYGIVPMISNIPESTRRPYMLSQNSEAATLSITIPAATTISAASHVVIVTGMYQCRAIFTISAGTASTTKTFAVSPGTTWSEWVGSSRVISEASGLTLHISSSGVVSVGETGSKVLSLDGSTAVRGSDPIQPNETYTIISYSG